MEKIEIRIVYDQLTQRIEVHAPMGGIMEKTVSIGLLEQAKEIVLKYQPRVLGATAIPDLGAKLRNGG